MGKQFKRVAATKENIENAYLDALVSGKSGKITVKEVCERASVNRTTFYKYYKDADHLGLMARQHLLDYLEKTLLETIPEDYADCYEFISQIILTIHRDRRVSRFPFLYREENFRIQADQIINKHYFYHKFGAKMSEDEWIRVTFCKCGIMGLVEKWIDDGMAISPEKIANQVISLSKSIKS